MSHVQRTPGVRRALGRGKVVTTVVVVAAAVLGLGGGATFALWRDSASTTARMPVGVAVFGAGAPGALTYAGSEADRLTFTFGPQQAKTLHDAGVVAIPVQVDSLSQGHRGLSYTLTPAVSGGIFGASTWRLVKVASAAACTPSATGSTQTTSTPWTSDYSAATTPTSEFWCLVASWASVTGTHSNTVTATGTPDIPGSPASVTATDRWSATVSNDLDPAAEPTHRLTFDFRTFRPGAAP